MHYAAFFRAVMIGRAGFDRDSVLRVFSELGAVEPRNLLATGNVLFTFEGDVDGFHAELVKGLRKAISHEKPIFIRSLRQLRALDRQNPFEGITGFRELNVSFGERKSPALKLPLWSKKRDCHFLSRLGTDVFNVTYDVDRNPPAPNLFLEKLTGDAFSTRNWNTVLKALVALEKRG